MDEPVIGWVATSAVQNCDVLTGETGVTKDVNSSGDFLQSRHASREEDRPTSLPDLL